MTKRIAVTAVNLTAANIAINAAYYLLTLGLGPWLFLRIENRVGLDRYPIWWLRGIGIAIGFAGISLQVWCIFLLQKVGRGTPSPALPPKRLVHTGPYRFVRNPLNIGELALFLALSAWFGSLALLLYAALAWVAFHVFIVSREEPRNITEFGNEYARYRENVNRWTPRLFES